MTEPASFPIRQPLLGHAAFPDAPQTTARVTRLELSLVVVLTMAGLAFRTWNLGAQGLDHFDEGVYVTSARGLYEYRTLAALYPNQERFSPLVFPALVTLSFAAGGVSDTVARTVPVLLGTLSIPVLWWIARSWFGPAAATAAACLLSFNELHIALSRAVLTDVPFAFVFVLAVAAVGRALRAPGPGTAIAAGLMTGLAWHTKYHGWFALLIGAGAAAGVWLRTPGEWRALVRRAVALVGAGAVAAGCYAVWLLYVDSLPGGYAALAAYQRTMLSREWLQNLLTQVHNQAYFDGELSRASLPLAAIGASLVAPVGTWSLQRIAVLVTIGAATFIVGLPGGVMTLAALFVLLPSDDRTALPTWLLFAWMALWVASTPLYHPYARLVLPLLLAVFIAAGAVLGRIAENARFDRRMGVVFPSVLAAALIAYSFWSAPGVRADPCWRPSGGLRRAASTIANQLPPGTVVITVGEPALEFYLQKAGRDTAHVDVIGYPKGLPMPAHVVKGIYSDRSPQLRQWFGRNADTLEPVGTASFEPGPLRLIDDFVPSELAVSPRPFGEYRLTLLRSSPKAPSAQSQR